MGFTPRGSDHVECGGVHIFNSEYWGEKSNRYWILCKKNRIEIESRKYHNHHITGLYRPCVSLLSQEIACKERLQNDVFCVGWDANLNSINKPFLSPNPKCQSAHLGNKLYLGSVHKSAFGIMSGVALTGLCWPVVQIHVSFCGSFFVHHSTQVCSFPPSCPIYLLFRSLLLLHLCSR